MKRSRSGLVLLIIGIVIVILAPIWKWGLAPQVVKLPDTVNTTSVYEGVETAYVVPNPLTVLPPDLTIKFPITITRVDASDKAKSNGSTAVIKETAAVKGPAGKDYGSYTKYYALDRKTAKNVTSSEADLKNRTGYSITLGFFVDKNGTFPFWNDDTATATNLQFVKTASMDGFKYKNIPVVVFKATGEAKIVNPPSGFDFPKEIPGSAIKAILGNPNLPFNDTQNYSIDYLEGVDATVIVDQKAGSVVDLPAYKESFFVDATAMGMGKIPLATIQYSQTPANIMQVLDDAAKSYALLNAVEIYIPIALLVIGLIILIIGLILYLRRPKARPAA